MITILVWYSPVKPVPTNRWTRRRHLPIFLHYLFFSSLIFNLDVFLVQTINMVQCPIPIQFIQFHQFSSLLQKWKNGRRPLLLFFPKKIPFPLAQLTSYNKISQHHTSFSLISFSSPFYLFPNSPSGALDTLLSTLICKIPFFHYTFTKNWTKVLLLDSIIPSTSYHISPHIPI